MTKIRILQPGDESVLEAYLLPLLDSSMFLLGNSRSGGLLDRGQRFQGTYAAAFESERIVGVAALYWNGSLVLQAPQHLDEVWRAAASASKRGIKRLIGPAAQVQAVVDVLGVSESNVQRDEPENLYSLNMHELIVPDALASGAVRSRNVEPRDVELCTAWRVGYYVELMGERDTPGLWQATRAGVEVQMDEGRLWILEDGAVPVAMSGLNSKTCEAVQVGGVWTPLQHRGKGYARAVVAGSLLDEREAGAQKAILFTGGDNIAAQKAYVALGFRHTGDYRILLLREPMRIGG